MPKIPAPKVSGVIEYKKLYKLLKKKLRRNHKMILTPIKLRPRKLKPSPSSLMN